ncbi:MAG TPA: EamA family transporter [Bacteroidota bacterium]
MDRSLHLKTTLAFFAIFVVWGSTYIAIKYAVETIPPFLMMGIRSVTAGIVLYLWGRSRGGTVQAIHWRAILIIGFAFFLIGHGLLAWAQREVPSGIAALLVASEPLWITAIEFIAFKDSTTRLRGLIGMGLGFAGIALLVASTNDVSVSGGDFIGVAAILVATLSWGGGAVYSRVARLPKSPPVAAGLELIAGGLMLLTVSAILGEPQTLEAGTITMRSVLGLAYLVLFGSVVTFSAYVWLLTFVPASRVSTHAYVNPIIAVLIGWVVADEALTMSMLAATAIIVTSVYLVLKR